MCICIYNGVYSNQFGWLYKKKRCKDEMREGVEGIVKDGFGVEIEEEYISRRAEDGIARPWSDKSSEFPH
jgi:hypothetical protein